jgi:hypothetical protein
MEQLSQVNIWMVLIALLWVLPWKGYALWIASERKNKTWFILILILNTFAILEIFYIFFIVKKKPSDLIHTIKSNFKK